jgi:glycosyltransferase involved in cell wall biosynthesis
MQAKILYLTAWYPNRYDHMPGLFVKRYADLLSKVHKIAVLNIIPVDKYPVIYEVEPVIEGNILVVRVYYRKINASLPLLGPFLKLLRSLIAYKKGLTLIFRDFGMPQLVHMNVLTIRQGIIALYLKNKFRIPYIITEHSSNFLPEKKEPISFFRKYLNQFITKRSAGTSAVSDALKNGMIAAGINHKRFHVIRNVVPQEFFGCEFIRTSNQIKVISNITCFEDAVKNISGLVRTIKELLKHRDDFLVLLIGDGPDRQKIEDLVLKLELTKYIKLTGLLEYNELVKAYQKSSFTVLFSHYETMSVVIAESLACGKPVVGTRAGGMPELVNNENGLLAEPGNESDLLNKIELMLDTFQNYNNSKIREYAAGLFSEEAVRNTFLSFYNEVIS